MSKVYSVILKTLALTSIAGLILAFEYIWISWIVYLFEHIGE